MAQVNILDVPAPQPGRRISYGPDPLQFGELRVAAGAGPHPLVVNIHGGFWRAQYDLTHGGHLCAALAATGCSTWNIEYRRVGHPGGGWPGTFDDVMAAFNFLPQLAAHAPVDLSRVVVIGHSAGGQLALLLAARAPRVRGVVALAAVSDLHRASELRLGAGAVDDFLGGPAASRSQQYRAASPSEQSIRVSQRLVHGALDDVVPVQLSRDYVAAKRAQGEDAQVIELPNADHFDVVDPRSAAWSTVESVVVELLR